MTPLLFVLILATQLPPIPPLPATSWPAADVAEPFARELVAQVPTDELAKMLRQKPELMPPILRNLGTALMGNDPRLPLYVAAVARAAAIGGEGMPKLAAIVLIDPLRYREDAAFRERMNALMPRIIAALPPKEAKAHESASALSGRDRRRADPRRNEGAPPAAAQRSGLIAGSRRHPRGFEFLMTWNNVVLERRRAEGFASLLEPADRAAQHAFEAAGYKLVLFPPLINSIVLGGGYRCASNHVRPR